MNNNITEEVLTLSQEHNSKLTKQQILIEARLYNSFVCWIMVLIPIQ